MNPLWLKEWELHQALRSVPAEDVVVAQAQNIPQGLLTVSHSTSPALGIFSALWRSIDHPGPVLPLADTLNVSATGPVARKELNPGDVLHLAPEITGEEVDPVYVLVTESRDNSVLLVAFSSMSLPAAGDELLTGFHEEGLKVLSTWNAYWVSTAFARQSWHLKTDTEALMQDLAFYRESILKGHGIPEQLIHRVGPPLSHPDDPRWAYYVQEGNKLIKVVELSLQSLQ